MNKRSKLILSTTIFVACTLGCHTHILHWERPGRPIAIYLWSLYQLVSLFSFNCLMWLIQRRVRLMAVLLLLPIFLKHANDVAGDASGAMDVRPVEAFMLLWKHLFVRVYSLILCARLRKCVQCTGTGTALMHSFYVNRRCWPTFTRLAPNDVSAGRVSAYMWSNFVSVFLSPFLP